MTRPLRRAEMNRSPCLDVSVSRGQGSHVAGLREILHQYARAILFAVLRMHPTPQASEFFFVWNLRRVSEFLLRRFV